MKASENCFKAIREHEGLRLESYLCPAGHWSVGYGSTRGIHEGVRITPEMAEALLLEDVLSVEADLRLMTTGLVLTQGMWDALVSLCYNLRGGPRALPMRAPKLWRYMKEGKRELAAAEFMDINKAKDPKTGAMVELPGLTRRRRAEATLFTS
jgi:lysozyme